jgi:hypothetical protein
MFGILLPVNFASPYKSVSVVEFWRRWHISLSRFLRNYLYIGLGGNRRGPARRYLNLMATMVLGGLWHGAGWTFLCWGALHGAYLVVNHLWNGVTRGRSANLPGERALAWALTMLAVVVAWVLFRADSFTSAGSILRSMAGDGGPPTDTGFLFARTLGWIAIAGGWAICVFLPSALELVRYPQTTPGMPIEHDGIMPFRWQPPALTAAMALGVIAAAAFIKLPDPGVFLYFNF